MSAPPLPLPWTSNRTDACREAESAQPLTSEFLLVFRNGASHLCVWVVTDVLHELQKCAREFMRIAFSPFLHAERLYKPVPSRDQEVDAFLRNSEVSPFVHGEPCPRCPREANDFRPTRFSSIHDFFVMVPRAFMGSDVDQRPAAPPSTLALVKQDVSGQDGLSQNQCDVSLCSVLRDSWL